MPLPPESVGPQGWVHQAVYELPLTILTQEYSSTSFNYVFFRETINLDTGDLSIRSCVLTLG